MAKVTLTNDFQKMTIRWHQTPRDGGQLVQVRYADLGANGCIRRTVDPSEPSTVYELAEWDDDGVFEPWNGTIGSDGAWEVIDEDQALALLRRR